ncbi:restriction endonuclease subunit R [Spirulina sp. CS-785/01]|uniref:restriction endonuclease subunit R n=1 Tax=Spirulina sp. CS-785/01 TaxID=3021716 RepID=UPI00232E1F26|nr:restriction endonuclease subunit R [Spirulina sp. CS-785/01]MDB9315181.1 restriction endonuclease subunit R [Spirulina sp. CS-785/01]
MSPTAITQRIVTLQDAEQQFNLVRTVDPDFFPEWQRDLSPLTDTERAELDRIKARYRYHRASGQLAEGVVNLMIVSPILELAGFYDPPFRVRGEVPVEVTISRPMDEVETETLRGRIDFLVVSEALWVVVLESKGTELNLENAIPQTLAYMMANPQSANSVFGMVTNGGEFVFLKLTCQGTPQYDVSRVFSHLPLQNEFYTVLQILKRCQESILS